MLISLHVYSRRHPGGEPSGPSVFRQVSKVYTLHYCAPEFGFASISLVDIAVYIGDASVNG